MGWTTNGTKYAPFQSPSKRADKVVTTAASMDASTVLKKHKSGPNRASFFKTCVVPPVYLGLICLWVGGGSFASGARSSFYKLEKVAAPPDGIDPQQAGAQEHLESLGYHCFSDERLELQDGPFERLEDAIPNSVTFMHKRLTAGGAKNVELEKENEANAFDSITVLGDGTLCVRERSVNVNVNVNVTDSEGSVERDGGDVGAQERGLKQDDRFASVGDAELDMSVASQAQIDSQMALRFPFGAVGRLENGCTGFFIGRCHVLTAGHCALDPSSFSVSQKLKITPGQTSLGDAPYGTFDTIGVKVARRWATFADPAYDAALIHVKGTGQLVDEKLGYLPIGDGGESDLVVNLNLAGYPETKPEGEMWFDYCENVPFFYTTRKFIDHGCEVVGGNSGSPMWVFKSGSGEREVRALHVATLIFGRRVSDTVVEVRGTSPQAVILSGDLLDEIKSWMAEMTCA